MPKYTNTCVVAADAARARLYVYAGSEDDSELPRLVEVQTLVSPERLSRDSEVFSEPRPGLRQASRGGQQHGVDDRRGSHRDVEAQRFADDIVAHAAEIHRDIGPGRIVVLAPAGMLGHLRKSLASQHDALRDVQDLVEEQADLTQWSSSQIHDRLAKHDLLPQRWMPQAR